MAIVGFNFNKLVVERKMPAKGKVNIKNNVVIKKVENADLPFGKGKQAAVKYTFEFTANYEPKVGAILLEGELIDIQEEKKVKEIVEGWNKNKKIEPAIMTPILNTILTKSNVEALVLSREINLPPPIPMPKVNVKASAK